LLALPACGNKHGSAAPDALPDQAAEGAAAPAAGDATPDGVRETPAADAAREASAPRVSRTQEQIFDEAKRQIDQAEAETRKKTDCAKLVGLLDVSFATIGPAMLGEDRAPFLAFASCAEKEQRWRLLRAVANAIIAGDPAQKSTYFLPRALLGLGQYDAAARLSAASLKLWPKEGEAYLTGALASTRIEDWEATKKEADQALLVQHQSHLADEISAAAHVFKAEALLHLGKIEDSSHELDLAKKVKGADADSIAKLKEANDVAKSSGVILDAALPDEVPLGVYPFFAKSLALTGGLVNMRLSNLQDKPVTVRIEVSLTGLSEGIGKSFTLVKGRPQTVHLTPPLGADFKPKDLKEGSKHDLAFKITSPDGAPLYQQTQSVTVLPQGAMPRALQVHGIDDKLVPELAAAWITPAAKAVAGVIDAAKKRVPGGQFTGTGGETVPQVKALWDELRERGFGFVRDPQIDSEATRTHPTQLPAETVAASSGCALEGTVLFAALLESIGFDVVLARVPGHAFVGWMPSKADHSAPGAMDAAVKSPVGTAFFLETTMIGSAPADAAVLRGAAEIVDAVTKNVLEDGRGSLLKLSALRKLGITPQPE
jgi:tetratricopeptide (TPR) repeat protein